jgi:hypothetical protein
MDKILVVGGEERGSHLHKKLDFVSRDLTLQCTFNIEGMASRP